MSKYAFKPTAVDGIYTRNGRYYIVASVGGQRIRRRSVCDSGASPSAQLQQAREELAKLQADAAKAKIAGTHGVKKAKRYLWVDAAKRYLAESQNCRSLRQIAGRILYLEETEILDGLRVDEITRDHVIAIYHDRRAHGNAATSSLHFVSLTRTILRRARDSWGWVSKIPAINEKDFHRLEKEGAFDDRRDRVLSYDEEDRLLDAIAPHLQDVVRFALATMLRKSNVFGMRWEYVDFENDVITLPASVMKSKRQHQFPIPQGSDAREILERNRNDTEWVFLYQHGQIKDLDHSGWKGALKRAGIEGLRFHDLRATAATRLANSGCPVHTLARLGAWGDVDILLNRYYRPKAQDLGDYVKAMSRPAKRPALKVVS